MEASFTVQEIGIFVLWTIGVVFGIYLIIAIKNLGQVLKQINRVIETNEKPMEETMHHLPGVLENTKVITEEVKKGVEHVGPSIPGTLENVQSITEAVMDSVQKVHHTVDDLEDSILQTSATFKGRASSLGAYVPAAIEMVKTIIHKLAKAKDKETMDEGVVEATATEE